MNKKIKTEEELQVEKDFQKANDDYYARKMKHREEMLPYLAACLAAMILIVLVSLIVNVLGGW